MSDVRTEAVGGWLKDEDCRMGRDYRRLGDIPVQALNAEHIAYFEDYRRRYFNDCLVPGQGAEDILDALKRHGGAPKHWIDLGGGVTTLFWSIGVNKPRAISVCDLVPEALHVLSAFKASSELPKCYRDALYLVGRKLSEFEATRTMLWNFHVMDCLNTWSLPDVNATYDMITAIGCFGLATGADGYERAFLAAAKRLALGGKLIGADWIRSNAFVKKEGHDNRYLGEDLALRCALHANLVPLCIKRVTIAGDPYYDAVIVWAFHHDG